jgi:hypothetical protein
VNEFSIKDLLISTGKKKRKRSNLLIMICIKLHVTYTSTITDDLISVRRMFVIEMSQQISFQQAMLFIIFSSSFHLIYQSSFP